MLQIFLCIILFITFHLIWGYLIAGFLFKKWSYLNLPIYFCVGTAFASLVLTSIVVYDVAIAICFYILGIVLFLYKIRKKVEKVKSFLHKLAAEIRKEYVVMGLFLLSIGITIKHLLFMERDGIFLPEKGDALHIGAYTSAIIFSKNTFFNYPTGGHVVAAAFSQITNIYPGEAVFATAILMQPLLSILLCCIIYKLTNSKIFGIIAFLITFWVPTAWEQYAIYWLSGRSAQPQILFLDYYNMLSDFYNGSFMRIWGLVYVLLFMYLTVEIYVSKRYEQKMWHCIALLAITFSAIILTYSLYLSVILLFIAFVVFFSLFFDKRLAKTFFYQTLLGLGFTSHFIYVNLSKGEYAAGPYPYSLCKIGLFLLLCFGIIAFLYCMKKLRKKLFAKFVQWLKKYFAFIILFGFSAAFFAFVVFAISAEYNLNLYTNLWHITPFQYIPTHFRFIVFHIAVAYLTFITIVYFVAAGLRCKIKKVKFLKSSRLKPLKVKFQTYKKILAIGIVILFGPQVISHVFVHPSPRISGADLNALKWLDENVPADALILNDPLNWNSYYIPTFSVKKIVFWGVTGVSNLLLNKSFFASPSSMTDECRNLLEFDIPMQNFTNVTKVLKKWDVKYIFISSQRTDAYIELWDLFESTNPSVLTVFKEGNARIYKVLL